MNGQMTETSPSQKYDLCNNPAQWQVYLCPIVISAINPRIEMVNMFDLGKSSCLG